MERDVVVFGDWVVYVLRVDVDVDVGVGVDVDLELDLEFLSPNWARGILLSAKMLSSNVGRAGAWMWEWRAGWGVGG